MLFLQVEPQIIETNFSLKLCQCSKLSLVHDLINFVTYITMLILTVQLASSTSNINQPVYLKT